MKIWNIYIKSIFVSKILCSVTEQTQTKLPSLELMDVRFGRSTFIHFKSFHFYFALSMNRNH